MMSRNPDPIAEYQELFARALNLEGEKCATAATLATADIDGRPAARVVLIKHVDTRGFVFYTNLESRKAQEMHQNPRVALCVYWSSLDKQVRIEGRVEPVDDVEADAYFVSRPRGSQIGAWTSKQSAPLGSRKELMTRYLKIQARFAGKEVPRPAFWGGYRVLPDRIEIWHNQTHRLHDRFLYLPSEGGWSVQRLYP
jgi:pyridoxamine 5'-phosphate oxidase